jgi:hypothetical protein
MKTIILLLAILFSAASFSYADGRKKILAAVTTQQIATTYSPKFNLEKVKRKTKNVSALQPVIALLEWMKAPSPTPVAKQDRVFLINRVEH